jgi:hypothetical protein
MSKVRSEEERVKLADLHKAGYTVRAIATKLGRSPSTISRELRRNSGTTGVYRPFYAHKLARVRRSRVRPGKVAANQALRDSECIDELGEWFLVPARPGTWAGDSIRSNSCSLSPGPAKPTTAASPDPSARVQHASEAQPDSVRGNTPAQRDITNKTPEEPSDAA